MKSNVFARYKKLPVYIFPSSNITQQAMEGYYYGFIPIGAAAFIYLVRKLREFQWGWIRNKYSLKDKVFIVTGANTGLGYETTKAFVQRDAKVILACRSEDRAQEAIAKIRKTTGKGEMIFEKLDLCSFQSIHNFANIIKKDHPSFDCIVNNAGLALRNKQYTKENYEIHFGVNHLGHYLLFDLLKDNIKRNDCRVVVVSSRMHEKGKIDFENLGKYVEDPNTNRLNTYYNNSKLMNFYFARELYKRGFDCHVLCPGLCHTDFFRDYNPRWYHYILFSPIVWLMLRSAEQGAQNIIYAATDNVNTEEMNPTTGYYVRNLKQTKSKMIFKDEISEKLWNESMKMISQK